MTDEMSSARETAGRAARAMERTAAQRTGTITSLLCSLCGSRSGDEGAASQLKSWQNLLGSWTP